MTVSKVCFCVLNAAYIDPAIVSLSSFFKYNDLPVIVFYESGTDISLLKAALTGYEVDFREREFPDFPEHKTVGDKYFNLFCSRESMPCYAARIQAIEELREEYDFAVNFDLDTLFFNTIEPLLQKIDALDPVYVFGVSERKNRDRWIRNLGVSDVIPGSYINTGFCIYGAEAEEITLSGYQQFLRDFSAHIYCPKTISITFRSRESERQVLLTI